MRSEQDTATSNAIRYGITFAIATVGLLAIGHVFVAFGAGVIGLLAVGFEVRNAHTDD